MTKEELKSLRIHADEALIELPSNWELIIFSQFEIIQIKLMLYRKGKVCKTKCLNIHVSHNYDNSLLLLNGFIEQVKFIQSNYNI